MRRLNEPRPAPDPSARRVAPDRGATAVIVALVAVILFTIAAWVIDGSALYQERRELQNGADAAALAIAQDCALGDCGAYNVTAEFYVDANANDGDSDVPIGGVTFPDDHTVRVEVLTADAGPNVDGDSSTLDYTFATVIGKSGFTVRAAAEASWGAVSGGATLPITASWCEFIGLTTNPVTGDRVWEEDVVIFFHTGNGNSDGPEDCAAQAGQDVNADGRLPGGFGWLQQDECISYFEEDGWVGGKPGAGSPRDCDPTDLLGQEIMLPIFNDLADPEDTGFATQCQLGPGGKCYQIQGFAVFRITGFRFPGGKSWVQGDPVVPCDPPDNCIGGQFIKWHDFLNAPGGGGTNFGAVTVWLSS